MTTRLSCWTDWILRLAAVAGIMASRDRVQSRRLRTWTIQHLLRRRLAQEFEHFAAVSREWNRLAKWQLGADFRQRNPGIRPIWGARRHQTRRIRWNSIDERLPGSGKLREPPRANWASRGDLAGKFGERAGRHRNWRGRSTICEHRHHRLPFAGKALSNGTGNITVTAPDITGANFFDLLRVTPVPNFREQAPFGTGNYAVATNVLRSSACSNGVCTFTDTQSALQSYTVATPTYFPLLDFWPGNLVLGANQDSSSPLSGARAWLQSVPSNVVAVQGTVAPAVISTSCDAIAGWTPTWISCYASMAPSTFFEQGAFLMAVKPNQDAGQKTNLKGRLNFSTLGTGPGHIITLSDSNFQKTIATANNPPSNDANDAYVGYDQGDGNPANIGITLGAPKSVSQYIANAGDGTNWLERLTANLKEFKTNVQMDGALTVSGPVTANSFVSTGAGPWSVTGSFGTLGTAASGKSLLGFGTNGKPQVSENGAAVVEVAKLDVTGNFAGNGSTATALAHTPTQCSNSFATGIQANGNANCSTADVIQLAETTPPAGIANYGIFWFDSTCHCPKVISNNGQAVQLGLLNVFNPDANTLEEYNGTKPQILRVYGTRTDASNYERIGLKWNNADGYFALASENAGTGTQRGIAFLIGSTVRWALDTASTLKPFTDNSFNIGSATLRPKTVYAGTSFDISGSGAFADGAGS